LKAVTLHWLFIIVAFSPLFAGADTLDEEAILRKTAEKAKKNEEVARNYGFKLQTVIKKMDSEDKLEEEATKDSHIIWVEGKPYNELLKIDGKEHDSKQKSAELKKKKEFSQSVRDKKKTIRESLTWDDAFQKYDFSFLPPEDGARYVISFKPKAEKLKERNVYEKVLNHLFGKAWFDEQFNLVKAEAWLTEGIRFGFGIFGKIDAIHLTYSQQEFENVWLPMAFHLRYKARRFIFKENQEITTRFYDFYPRPDFNPQEDAGSNRP
jgi:hypothetical protein